MEYKIRDETQLKIEPKQYSPNPIKLDPKDIPELDWIDQLWGFEVGEES
jgi:hypothetical protein